MAIFTYYQCIDHAYIVGGGMGWSEKFQKCVDIIYGRSIRKVAVHIHNIRQRRGR